MHPFDSVDVMEIFRRMNLLMNFGQEGEEEVLKDKNSTLDIFTRQTGT